MENPIEMDDLGVNHYHWQDESYACWASQEVKPFPP